VQRSGRHLWRSWSWQTSRTSSNGAPDKRRFRKQVSRLGVNAEIGRWVTVQNNLKFFSYNSQTWALAGMGKGHFLMEKGKNG